MSYYSDLNRFPVAFEEVNIATVTNDASELNVDQVGGSGQYLESIRQVDGKISAVARTFKNASETAAGLMSSADFNKLSQINDGDTIASVEYVDNTLSGMSKEDTAVSGQYVSAVSETDGVISVSRQAFPAASAAQAGLMSSADFAKLSGIAPGDRVLSTADINALDKADYAVAGQYVSAVSETDGIIDVTRQAFPVASASQAGIISAADYTRFSNSASGSYATAEDIANAINALDVETVGGGENEVISSIGEVNGKITATKKVLNVATAADITNAINALDKADAAIAGQYVSSVTETDGVISVDRTAFPVASATQAGFMSSAQYVTLNNISTSTDTAIDNKINALDVAEVGGTGKYISSISETDGKIVATATDVSDILNGVNVAEVGGTGKYIQTIKEVNGRIVATAADLNLATASDDGLLSAQDFSKLSSVATGEEIASKNYVLAEIAKGGGSSAEIQSAINNLNAASVGGGTNQYISSISETAGVISATVSTLPTASAAQAGMLSAADFIKLNGVPAGETIASTDYVDTKVNGLDVTDTAVANKYVSAVNETDGKIMVTRAAFPEASSAQAGFMSAADFSKLATVAAGDTIASTDDIADAISALDVTDAAVANKYVSAVSETDGKISVTRASFPDASATQSGFMSSTDFTKLSAVATGKTIATTDDVTDAVSALDVTDAAVSGKYVSAVSETDGKISVTRASFPDASATQAGLMSSDDFSKLSVITTGKTIATTDDVTDAVEALDVAEIGGAGKYITSVSEVNGKISASFETIADTYSSTGTAAVNGKAIADAIDTLDVAEVGDSSSFIQKIKEEDGKIVATKADIFNFVKVSSLPADPNPNYEYYLTATDGTNKPGIYSYNSGTSTWSQVANKASATLTGGGNAITELVDDNGSVTLTMGKTFIETSKIGQANGVAELDDNGKIPEAQLPAYVSDILEYPTVSDLPTTGQSGKIYVAADTNSTYRWTGTTYVNIGSAGSGGLQLGETSATAYRGDRGATAYTHATDGWRLQTAQASGLYKFSVTDQGHVGGVTAIAKADITALGIAEDSVATASANGLMSKEDFAKLSSIASTDTIAKTDDISDAIAALDVASVGGSGKYISAISETDGKILATASSIATTYSATGTDAISGTGVAAAIAELDVAEVGGAGKYISAISETDGKISATASSADTTYSATGVAPISGAGVAAAIATLDVAEVGGAGKYISAISETDGKISAAGSDIAVAYSATDTAPISGKGVAAAIATLTATEVGGAGKYISAISEANGVITATATSIVDTFSATSTDAISGKGVAEAVKTAEITISGTGIVLPVLS